MLERFFRFSCGIFEISRCWHRLAAEEMEKQGLRGPYAIYLLMIWREQAGITAAQLSEMCGRDKADVSRAVSMMEKKGLLTKEGSAYRAVLKLTELGSSVAEHVCRRAAVAVENAGQGFSAEQREVFYQVLETITGNLQDLSKKGLPE